MIPISDGGRPRGSFPVVNVILLGLNALVFLYEIAVGGIGFLFGADSVGIVTFFYKFGFIPAELSSGTPYQVLLSESGLQLSIVSPVHTWATVLTSMFIHGGLMHFAGNMLFLWVFGDNIEDTFGHVKYLAFYLAAGVLATLSHFAIDTGSQTPLVGASGAISGVMGAYLLLYPRNRIRTLIWYIVITVVNLRAVWLLLIWIGLQVIQGVLSFGVSNQVSTAFFAHIGGFAVGLAVAGVYKMVSRGTDGPSGYGGRRSDTQPRYWRGRRID